jgi:hypothetical protein
VAQGVGPEFKPQYYKKKKERKDKNKEGERKGRKEKSDDHGRLGWGQHFWWVCEVEQFLISLSPSLSPCWQLLQG